MNNKAFTVVELLASFTLTMIIVVFLFEIVLQLKEVYINDSYKTKVLTQNALIATSLDKKLEKGIYQSSCSDGNTCSINNGSYNILIEGKKIKIGNETFTMPDNTTISVNEKYKFQSDQNFENGDAYIKIAYIVESQYLKEPIKFTYTFSYKAS